MLYSTICHCAIAQLMHVEYINCAWGNLYPPLEEEGVLDSPQTPYIDKLRWYKPFIELVSFFCQFV